MPTRYLKQGICDSKLIDKLSPMAEILYYRLLVNVDDFGRLDARLPVIRSRCFPLKEDLTTKDVKKWLDELSETTLTVLYRIGEDDYLQINKWTNKPRSDSSLYPECTPENIQLYADVYGSLTSLPVTVTVTVTETVTNNRSSYDDSFLEFWKMYPNKTGKGAAWKAWKNARISEGTMCSIKVALSWQIKSKKWTEGYIPNPSTYLNQRRWEDEPELVGTTTGKFDAVAYANRNNKGTNNDKPTEKDITTDSSVVSEQ